MLSGVARYIHEHGRWALYLKPFRVEKSLHDWLEHWNGDGIIAAIGDPEQFDVRSLRMPIVDVMGVKRFPGVPLVHTNDEAVGRLGAEHLLERGFRQFGFVEYQGRFWSERRRAGFLAALGDLGPRCSVHTVIEPSGGGGPAEFERQQNRLAEWLQTLPKPVGIMATNDLLGQQVLEACMRLGVEVPEQVAVVGADNDEPICSICYPPLSSVIINDHQRGYEAAAVLDRLMSGREPLCDPTWVEPVGVCARQSTDIMAIDDELVARALRFIRDHASEPIGVDDVVAEIPLSRSMLERRFRQAVGRSINSEIVRTRINQAIGMLTQTELGLKEVALRCGFGAQAYMNAVFQQKLGRTPGSYRKPHRPGGMQVPMDGG